MALELVTCRRRRRAAAHRWTGHPGIRNRSTGFDRFPFILLNLVLSCLAALQGAILLIAAKRSDQIAGELARHDYEADTRTRDVVEQLSREVAALRVQQSRLLRLIDGPAGDGIAWAAIRGTNDKSTP